VVGDNNYGNQNINFGRLCRKNVACNGHAAKPMDQPTFQRRIDSGSSRYK
jgi:hypothetical protein